MGFKALVPLAVALTCTSLAASAQSSGATVVVDNLSIRVSGPDASVTFHGPGGSAISNVYTPADGLTSHSASSPVPFAAVQSGAVDSGGSAAAAVSGDPFIAGTGHVVAQAIENAPNGDANATFDIGGGVPTSFTLSGDSTLTITAQVIESWQSGPDTLDADAQFAFHLEDGRFQCQATSCVDLDHGLGHAGDPPGGFLVENIAMTFTNASAGAVNGVWFAGGGADVQTITATTVPEPANAVLLLAGLGALGAVARRRASDRG